ncbi:hypothetical protein AC579_3909 [Pseudocercospora musae]|uniref:Uncharacterized protein n=1 Tax=Pseudocercospora musae TaxID=113226 RepID=A0A139HZU2_9PEZI|nr:hypothetical protein AC579_3909 [Pseudocercospora musae]
MSFRSERQHRAPQWRGRNNVQVNSSSQEDDYALTPPNRSHAHKHQLGSSRPISPSSANLGIKRRSHNSVEGHHDPVGLRVLHEPEGPPVADLVFVHSLGGGSQRTWSDDGRTESFWPLYWLPYEMPLDATRIHTYGYSSHVSPSDPEHLLEISDLAKDLLAKLRFGTGRQGRSLEVGSAPLIFVAHSLGGLIIKKAYLLASSEHNTTYGDIAQATTAFLFLSTPHRGIDRTGAVDDILSLSVEAWKQASQLGLTREFLSRLQEINEQFRDLANLLKIYSFYERPATRDMRDPTGLILPENIATMGHPSEVPIPLDASHATITKFSSQADPNYISVRGALRALVERHAIDRSAVQERWTVDEDEDLQFDQVSKLLHPSDAPEDDLAFFSGKRVSGSCEWVFRQPVMVSFLSNDELNPQILWCSGALGSGKSVTATHVIETLIEESKPCAYYYFRSGHQVNNTLSQFLTTVAFQLSQILPEYRRKLCRLAENRFDVGKAGQKLLWKKLFLTCLLQCNETEPLYLVIDGLDELPQHKELLQRMLPELQHAGIPLRILIISRSTAEIEASIEKLSKKITIDRMSLDSNAEDLDLYVREEMDSMLGDDHFKVRTLEEILAMANGNFLWAHLVVREILHCRTEVQVESALRQVPRELAPLYERMDTQLADMFRSRPQDKDMGHLIIIWVICARRTLHLEELQGALEHDFPRILNMRQTVQSLCGEFIVVDRKSNLSIMHASAREFLTTNPHLNYYVSAPSAHQSLFSSCLQALSVGRRGRQPLGDTSQSFLDYAASSWPYHLSQSCNYSDQSSFTILSRFFAARTVLDWIFMLAHSHSLRAMVEASKALSKLLKALDVADQNRSPLLHKLDDKESLRLWSQDLIRVVGEFGSQITRQPQSVYSLLPVFCPKESILHRQFHIKPSAGQRREGRGLRVRGKMSPTWGDCFAKFAIAGGHTPHAILSLDRYFAILTSGDGTVHLHYSTTCDVARRLRHAELVSTWSVDLSLSCIATYGYTRTMVWDIESGRMLFSVENPSRAKALAIAFQRDNRGSDTLITCSDDGLLRTCSFETPQAGWKIRGSNLGEDTAHLDRVNSPHNATFSPDGHFLAISYRAANPSVWLTGSANPRRIGQCDFRARRSLNQMQRHTNYAYVTTFAWNPLTNHVLGLYLDGAVFKWHPQESDDFILSTEFACTAIRCSADGKLFATASLDGTLRVWDFEHFTPIYHLRYPVSIRDLDLGVNEARIYDLRDQYCNIWEPGSLLKALESDDATSDAQSNRGSEHPSLASEAVQEDFEPVTAMSARQDVPIYAVGDDAGQILISNLEGDILLDIQDGSMSAMGVDKLVWCDDRHRLAGIDIGRQITIWQLPRVVEMDHLTGTASILRSFSEHDAVLQALFDPTGDKLLIATPTGIKIHSVLDSTQVVVVPVVVPSHWLPHPHDKAYAIGLGARGVTLLPWHIPLNITCLEYDATSNEAEIAQQVKRLQLHPRRPSQAYPMSPSEVSHTVDRAFLSPDGRIALIEVYDITKQISRRHDTLLMRTAQINNANKSSTVSVRSIAPAVAEVLYKSLGFVDCNNLVLIKGARSMSEHRRSIQRRDQGLSTFVFVDKDFWVCSVDIGYMKDQQSEIVKHFFLPRDWQNSEWLDMATVMTSGDFLCPRNGTVAVVSDWLGEEFDGRL